MNKFVVALVALLAVTAFASKVSHLKYKETNPIFPNETYYSGFVPIEEKGDLFYWWFESRNDTNNDPLLLWLTGGPGCSSELALFEENGPFKINDDLSLKTNPNSWNSNANLLYVDQPLGTGYSNATQFEDSEAEVAEDFYTFITAFIAEFPQFKGRKFFITGESYAGHYVPAISAYLKKKNNPDVNLQGSAIGNGLVSSYWQYPQYAVYAYENKLISEDTYNSLVKSFSLCQNLIKYAPWTVALTQCQIAVTEITGNPPKFNVYDIDLPCNGPLCYNFTIVDDFLARSDVQEAIGVTGHTWSECNNTVHEYMMKDWFTDESSDVAYLLGENYPVLVYSGDLDFICNWRGGEKWTNELQWAHQSEFNSANYTILGTYGEYKNVETFTFYRVYQAGHMVPMDQPEAALDMVNQFMTSGTVHN